MYEFLDEGMTYDELDEYQKHKADWLEESNRYSDTTKRAYWIHLNTKVHYIEESKGKDLFHFDKQEIINLVKYAPTNSLATKTALYTTISRYMGWACDKGHNYTENPCDTIDTKDLLIINKLAFKKSYQTLPEFYEFISELECSDVDRAMFTLLRYGVKVDDVGTVKWEDIDRKNKVINIYREETILELPIDSIFLMIIDRAKSCETRMSGKREINYIDYGYVVKSFEGTDWQYMTGDKVYNRAGEITRVNKISRISVPELNVARKYDLLFNLLDKKGTLSSKDIEDVLLIVDGYSTVTKKTSLKRDFELLSGIKVEKMKTGKKKAEKVENDNTELSEVSIEKESNVIQLSDRI